MKQPATTVASVGHWRNCMLVRSTSAVSYRGQRRRRGCRTKIYPSPPSQVSISQQPLGRPRSQEKTNNNHTDVTISLNINASSRQELLPGAHPVYSRGCAAQGRDSISGLRCLGQPRDGAPSAGSAALASPGKDLHQRAPLTRQAWGQSSISGLGLSARRGVNYL